MSDSQLLRVGDDAGLLLSGSFVNRLMKAHCRSHSTDACSLVMSSTTNTPTTRVLVWDLPTRLLHWLLAASFAGAFAVALLVKQRSPAFPVHMLLGAIAALVVSLRIVWGFVGSRYARFRTFAFGPRAVAAYVRDAFTGRGEAHVGHNPANGWVAFAMIASILGVALTGALMSRGGRVVKEIHEILAYTMAGLVAVHLAGLALHTWKRRENIALGMIDGKKPAAPAQAIASAHPIVAVVLVTMIGAWAGVLVQSYDAESRSVTLAGLTIKLGGKKRGDMGPPGERRERRHDD